MGEMQNYKCRACGAPLVFDEESQKLKCQFCGTSYDLSEYEQIASEDQSQAEDMPQWGKEGMKYYSCPSCGAEIMCDQTTAATCCPYCGNNAVMPGQFEAGRQPDFILPFKISREKAIAALEEHYKGKKLLPDSFRKRNQIEKIQGVYVPFWLFDKEASGAMEFKTSNSEIYRRGDYMITDTRHYAVNREGTMGFEKVPVDASTKMPDDYMDSIEPFQYEDLKPFSTVYMPGFLADKYDVEADKADERAKVRCTNTMEDSIRQTVSGYEVVSLVSKDIQVRDKASHYALLPIWTLATRWKDQSYLFVINGQTGKLVGDLPMDTGKFRKYFWGITLGLGAGLSLLFSGLLGTWFANLF